jgi:hypothetical protein
LVEKRTEEIREMEVILADKEALIGQLEQKLRSMSSGNQPVPPPKALPRGDLLDEMIG